MLDDEILDDLFHGVAFDAFVTEAARLGTTSPPIDATRQLAYANYERELAAKSGTR